MCSQHNLFLIGKGIESNPFLELSHLYRMKALQSQTCGLEVLKNYKHEPAPEAEAPETSMQQILFCKTTMWLAFVREPISTHSGLLQQPAEKRVSHLKLRAVIHS